MRTYCFLIGHEWETRRIVTGVRVECRFCGAFGLYREDTQDFGVFWSPMQCFRARMDDCTYEGQMVAGFTDY